MSLWFYGSAHGMKPASDCKPEQIENENDDDDEKGCSEV
jgi:hypothetical protein